MAGNDERNAFIRKHWHGTWRLGKLDLSDAYCAKIKCSHLNRTNGKCFRTHCPHGIGAERDKNG